MTEKRLFPRCLTGTFYVSAYWIKFGYDGKVEKNASVTQRNAFSQRICDRMRKVSKSHDRQALQTGSGIASVTDARMGWEPSAT